MFDDPSSRYGFDKVFFGCLELALSVKAVERAGNRTGGGEKEEEEATSGV